MTKIYMKIATKILAVMYIMIMCIYSAGIIGTLAHELMHKQQAINKTIIQVNYDGTGVTYGGAFFRHSHEWVYLNGFIVEGSLIVIGLICVFILVEPIDNK